MFYILIAFIQCFIHGKKIRYNSYTIILRSDDLSFEGTILVFTRQDRTISCKHIFFMYIYSHFDTSMIEKWIRRENMGDL